jgi:hypothetical protein
VSNETLLGNEQLAHGDARLAAALETMPSRIGSKVVSGSSSS